MSAEMTPALLAAIDAALSAGGWRTVGVQLDRHEETIPGDASADPPTGPTTVEHVSATLQVENAARGRLLIFVLSGEGGTYSKAKLIAGGGSYETTNAALIARIAATITPALAAMQGALVADLLEGL